MPAKVHPLADCETCPLFGKKYAQSELPKLPMKAAVVSRSPAYHDVTANRPFSGPSGQVLNHLLERNGVKREEVLVTNVVLCTPDGGKVPPAAIKSCSRRLAAELEGCKLVIAAGSEAVNSLIGRGSVDKYRGYRISDDENDRTYVATNNPALVLRDDSSFPNLVRDFKRAFNPLPPPVLPEIEVIEDASAARKYLVSLKDGFNGDIVADVESRGGLTKRATLISVQFSTDSERAVVLGERDGIFDDAIFVHDYLRPLFVSTRHSFVWHNGQYDVKILQHTYDIPARIDQDTILLSHALDERPGTHGLEYLLMEHFGWPHYEDDEINQIKKTGIVTDYDKFYEYAGRDAAGGKQLFDYLKPLAQEETVW